MSSCVQERITKQISPSAIEASSESHNSGDKYWSSVKCSNDGMEKEQREEIIESVDKVQHIF